MRNNSITCFADLEREEIRVKKRLRKQEEEIRVRLKQLPEEVVTIAVSQLVSAIINGGIAKTGGKIFRSVISRIFRNDGSNSESGRGGFRGMITNLIQSFMDKNASKE